MHSTAARGKGRGGGGFAPGKGRAGAPNFQRR